MMMLRLSAVRRVMTSKYTPTNGLARLDDENGEPTPNKTRLLYD